MPEISRFLGIVIKMFFDDHNPHHFHAVYGTDTAAIAIHSLELLEGHLPPRIQGLVIEWASLYQKELQANWERRKKGLDLKKIKPLV
ncbi:MAG: uncharacterized protein HW387_50 [Parachlamydiales bacterium]|nr:uncharacterized protein [Parachlamydiales bacterium]